MTPAPATRTTPGILDDTANAVAKAVNAALDRGEQELPTLPDVALKIRMELRNERADANSMARMIGQDPGIATSIIRVVNTPLLRSLVPIKDLQGAVSRLGLEGAANLGVSLALRQVFDAHRPVVRAHMNSVREHAVRVAGLAYCLTHAHGRLPADQALLAGLTHSVGALPILKWMDTHPDEVADEAVPGVLAALHPELGGRVLTCWEFPRAIARVPGLFLTGQPSTRAEVADVVAAAYLLDQSPGCIGGILPPVVGKLGISDEDLQRCLDGAAEVTSTLSRR